jgi:hypothetical protein
MSLLHSFLIVFGWLWLVVAGAAATGVSFLYAMDAGGRWNIGGVPNSIWRRLSVYVVFTLVLAFWYSVYLAMPFSLGWKP